MGHHARPKLLATSNTVNTPTLKRRSTSSIKSYFSSDSSTSSQDSQNWPVASSSPTLIYTFYAKVSGRKRPTINTVFSREEFTGLIADAKVAQKSSPKSMLIYSEKDFLALAKQNYNEAKKYITELSKQGRLDILMSSDEEAEKLLGELREQRCWSIADHLASLYTSSKNTFSYAR